MNILDGTKYNFTYQSYNAIILDFDIYNDSNYWDSNVQGVEREIWFNLSISSTDFYSSDNLHVAFTYYDDFDLIYLRNQFINQSDFRGYLDNINMEIATSSYMYNGNNFIVGSNTMFQNYGNKFNFENSKDLVVYLWYDENDLYLDDAQITYTNKSNTPFGNTLVQDNYLQGYNEGYQNGISSTDNSIYQQGYQNGYDTGYSDGKIDGEADSAEDYYLGGYRDGYDDGKIVGYQYGDAAGYARGAAEHGDLSSMVLTIVDAPLNIFKTIFDVNILGINLVPLFFGFATLGVMVWVVRRFMGGD